MRGYGAISPQFWTGHTGKKLRKSKDARILATHLITGSSANMLGLYYLPMPLVVHETGLNSKEVTAAFEFLARERFAYYHKETEFVFVPAMARWQLGSLKPNDKKIPAINREYRTLPDNPFLAEFYDMHHKGLFLESRREWRGSQGASEGHRRGLEGASEGHPGESMPHRRDYGPGPGPDPDPDLGPGSVKQQIDVNEPRFSDDPQQVIDLWNDLVKPMGMPEAPILSDGVRKKITKAFDMLKERDDWIILFNEYRRSKWLRGQVRDHKKRDLMWLLQREHNGDTENYVKVLNGRYRDQDQSLLDEKLQAGIEAAESLLREWGVSDDQPLLTQGGRHGYGGRQSLPGAIIEAGQGGGTDPGRRAHGDLLRAPDGFPPGAGPGGDDLGDAEHDPLSDDRRSEDAY